MWQVCVTRDNKINFPTEHTNEFRMNKCEQTVSSLSQHEHLMLKGISSAQARYGNRLTQRVEVALVWHSSSHFLVLSKRSQNYTEL